MGLLNNKIEVNIEEKKHFRTWGYANNDIVNISSGYPDFLKFSIFNLSYGIWRFTLGTKIFEFDKNTSGNYYTVLPLTLKFLIKKPFYKAVIDFREMESKNKKLPSMSVKTFPVYLFGEASQWLTDRKYFAAGAGCSFNFANTRFALIPLKLSVEAGYKVSNSIENSEENDAFPFVDFSVSAGLWSPDFNFKVLYPSINFIVSIDDKIYNRGEEVVLGKGEHKIKLTIKNSGKGWTIIPFIFTIGGKSIDFCSFEFPDKQLKFTKDEEGIAVNTGKILKPGDKIEINFNMNVLQNERGSLIFEWTDFKNRGDVKDFTLFLKTE